MSTDSSEEWTYRGPGTGVVEAGRMAGEVGGQDVEIEMLPTDDTVNFAVRLDDEMIYLGATAALSPAEAERFAHDLLDCAAGARAEAGKDH